jgi:aryl-alcohol dehydrogenase-like predicted oxidoreductase/enamine deaminase RidA (YjgF/YER057c/UK114 family)
MMSDPIEYCQLTEDLKISRIITGLWQIADMEKEGKTLDPKKVSKSMLPYVQQGMTTFDMADHYGSAEVIAGTFNDALASDKRCQLLTKWVPKPGVLRKSDVEKAVHNALSRLNTEAIDLMQFHAWNYADPAWLDGLFWLDELRQKGLIRHLGLTNFDTPHLNMVIESGINVVTNQVCYSLLDQRAAHEMTAACLKHDIKLLAFGTLAGGFLTSRWLDEAEPANESLETWSQMKYKRFINQAGGWAAFQRLLKTLHSISHRMGVSIGNIASRYMLESPAVGGVIIGARLGLSDHIKENVKLFQFELDEKARQQIRNALREMDPIAGDCGDEYRKPPFLTASGDLSDHMEEIPLPFQTTEDIRGNRKVMSGTKWESDFGYCRAIRSGNRIIVSGTTASHRNRLIGGADPESQMNYVIDKIEGAVQSLGGSLDDVIRTRIFVKRKKDWESIAKTHGARFGHIKPVNTLVVADIIGEDFLVEMEVEAVAS